MQCDTVQPNALMHAYNEANQINQPMQPLPFLHEVSAVLLWHHHHLLNVSMLDVYYVMVTFSVDVSQRSEKLFRTQPVFHLVVIQPLCLRAGLWSFGSHCYMYVTKEHSWKKRSVRESS